MSLIKTLARTVAEKLADDKGEKTTRHSRCPNCGAGPEQRLRSGLGPLQEITCQACAHEFPKERAS